MISQGIQGIMMGHHHDDPKCRNLVELPLNSNGRVCAVKGFSASQICFMCGEGCSRTC